MACRWRECRLARTLEMREAWFARMWRWGKGYSVRIDDRGWTVRAFKGCGRGSTGSFNCWWLLEVGMRSARWGCRRLLSICIEIIKTQAHKYYFTKSKPVTNYSRIFETIFLPFILPRTPPLPSSHFHLHLTPFLCPVTSSNLPPHLPQPQYPTPNPAPRKHPPLPPFSPINPPSTNTQPPHPSQPPIRASHSHPPPSTPELLSSSPCKT